MSNRPGNVKIDFNTLSFYKNAMFEIHKRSFEKWVIKK